MLGIAGVFFGLIAGWMIGSQGLRNAPSPPAAGVQAASGTQGGQGGQGGQGQTAPLDESRVASLQAAAEKAPGDAAVRIQLADLYFDAERFADAARWYEDALKVDPKNVNASTDLGIAYYYMNQADRALAQFERSLALDPQHTKTLLNTGIVRAFGKQDLDGAAAAWQQVVKIAPDSPEARMAGQALQGLRTAHPEAASGGVPAATPQGR